MKLLDTTLPEVLLIEPKVFSDSRGFFLETFHAERYAEMGIPQLFVQDNYSRSTRDVLRGLHFQFPYAQGKLVSVARGEVFDVAVDIRRGSPNFGRWFGAVLSDQNYYQMYVPPGFAHGYCVLSDEADFLYKCADFYHPEAECGVVWDDVDIGIDWPVKTPKLSEKDKKLSCLKDIDEACLPVYEG